MPRAAGRGLIPDAPTDSKTTSRKYGYVFTEPQRHEDTKKAGAQILFNAGFLCVFVSLWFLAYFVGWICIARWMVV